MTPNELASELARRCRDSADDAGLDMDIAQASHAVRVLSEIVADNPAGVWVALGNHPLTMVVSESTETIPAPEGDDGEGHTET